MDNHKINAHVLLIFILVLSFAGESVQLENWRFPYYKLAFDIGELKQSPSGMFWDDLSTVQPFGKELWPDSQVYLKNHWTLEPAAYFYAGNEEGIDGENYAWHFEVLNNIRFKKLSVRQTLDVDSRYKKDPEYLWKKDRVAAGRIEEAYLQYDGKFGMCRFGRLKRNWGPFVDRSLLLSNYPHSYDAFEWQVFSKVFEFRHLFAAFLYPQKHFYMEDLDNFNLSSSAKVNRFFAAHSLNFMIGEWATLGITETILFVRDNEFPDLLYMNPFSIYTVTNTNGESGGNLIVGLQWKVHPFTKRVVLLGQVAFDDIQVDNSGAVDQEPMHWAIDAAAFWYNPLPIKLNQALKLEYQYLSRWFYTVADANGVRGERYTFLGQSLGNETVDGDNLNLAFSIVPKNYWAGTIGVSFSRQSGNTPLSRWSDYENYDTLNNVLGYRDETPLSDRDNLNRTINFYIDAKSYFKNYADIQVGFNNILIQKTENGNRGDFTYNPEIFVTLTAHYCNFFLSIPD